MKGKLLLYSLVILVIVIGTATWQSLLFGFVGAVVIFALLLLLYWLFETPPKRRP